MRPVQEATLSFDELVNTEIAQEGCTQEEAEQIVKENLKSLMQLKSDEELKELAVNVDKKTLIAMQEAIPRERIDQIAIEEAGKIIDILGNYDGLKIELKGTWVWISGETKSHREVLKMMKCRWCSDKKIWAWKHVLVPLKGNRPQSMRRIDRRYGTQRSVVGADPIPDDDNA